MCAGSCNDSGGAPGALRLDLTVNNVAVSRIIDPERTLLDFLREDLGLTGTKKGCDQGQCGACTIHVDGQRRLSCLQFAVQARGATITTIEGVASPDGELHPMQQAFINYDALQCGFCTPGQIMSALALMNEGYPKDLSAIKEAMSGNICRCGAYNGIVAAICEIVHETD